jgi:hypothetical protein
MTERQAVALANPCTRAVETGHPRFTAWAGSWFTILTINK